MCGSVEMLLRCCAENLVSEKVTREFAGKMLPCTNAEIFQWGESTVSIGGTLHLLTSPLRFISL
jgi:hypothetical protein